MIAEIATEAVAAAPDTAIDEDEPSKGNANIRVEFHSAPVVADVVGTRNPRFVWQVSPGQLAVATKALAESHQLFCFSP